MRNVVILGASGFIGSSLAAYWRVRADLRLFEFNSEQCNLLDPLSTAAALSKMPGPFSVVFLSSISRFPRDDFHVFQRNVAMATHLITALKSCEPESVLFLSSACIYGRPPRKLPITEDSPLCPSTHYGLSKLVSEQLLRWNLRCPVTALRIPGTFGKNDNGKSVVSQFLANILARKTLSLDHGGASRRDFLYVGDLLEVLDACLRQPLDMTVNVTSGDVVTIRGLVELLGDAVGVAPQTVARDPGAPAFDLVFERGCLLKHFPHIRFTPLKEAVQTLLPGRAAIVAERGGSHG